MSKAIRCTATACLAIVMAGTIAIAQESTKAGHKEPGPKPPKKYEALQNKGGGNPGPKPLPKNELYLIQGPSGSYLMGRALLDKLTSQGPPTCKVKCASGSLNGKQVSISESALQSRKLSPPVATYFKENAERFGPNTVKWPPPISPDVANAVGSGAIVELVAPMY